MPQKFGLGIERPPRVIGVTTEPLYYCREVRTLSRWNFAKAGEITPHFSSTRPPKVELVTHDFATGASRSIKTFLLLWYH